MSLLRLGYFLKMASVLAACSLSHPFLFILSRESQLPHREAASAARTRGLSITTGVSLEGDPSIVGLSDDCGPSQYLDCSLQETLGQNPLAKWLSDS